MVCDQGVVQCWRGLCHILKTHARGASEGVQSRGTFAWGDGGAATSRLKGMGGKESGGALLQSIFV